MLSSDIGSVWRARPGLRTSDDKSDFAALTYNSRLRGAAHILAQIQNMHKIWGLWVIFVDLSEFCVRSYGSVSDFRHEVRWV